MRLIQISFAGILLCIPGCRNADPIESGSRKAPSSASGAEPGVGTTTDGTRGLLTPDSSHPKAGKSTSPPTASTVVPLTAVDFLRLNETDTEEFEVEVAYLPEDVVSDPPRLVDIRRVTSEGLTLVLDAIDGEDHTRALQDPRGYSTTIMQRLSDKFRQGINLLSNGEERATATAEVSTNFAPDKLVQWIEFRRKFLGDLGAYLESDWKRGSTTLTTLRAEVEVVSNALRSWRGPFLKHFTFYQSMLDRAAALRQDMERVSVGSLPFVLVFEDFKRISLNLLRMHRREIARFSEEFEFLMSLVNGLDRSYGGLSEFISSQFGKFRETLIGTRAMMMPLVVWQHRAEQSLTEAAQAGLTSTRLTLWINKAVPAEIRTSFTDQEQSLMYYFAHRINLVSALGKLGLNLDDLFSYRPPRLDFIDYDVEPLMHPRTFEDDVLEFTETLNPTLAAEAANGRIVVEIPVLRRLTRAHVAEMIRFEFEKFWMHAEGQSDLQGYLHSQFPALRSAIDAVVNGLASEADRTAMTQVIDRLMDREKIELWLKFNDEWITQDWTSAEDLPRLEARLNDTITYLGVDWITQTGVDLEHVLSNLITVAQLRSLVVEFKKGNICLLQLFSRFTYSFVDRLHRNPPRNAAREGKLFVQLMASGLWVSPQVDPLTLQKRKVATDFVLSQTAMHEHHADWMKRALSRLERVVSRFEVDFVLPAGHTSAFAGSAVRSAAVMFERAVDRIAITRFLDRWST
jgi:hypothetical protein